jgi:hypothetical protein
MSPIKSSRENEEGLARTIATQSSGYTAPSRCYSHGVGVWEVRKTTRTPRHLLLLHVREMDVVAMKLVEKKTVLPLRPAAIAVLDTVEDVYGPVEQLFFSHGCCGKLDN